MRVAVCVSLSVGFGGVVFFFVCCVCGVVLCVFFDGGGVVVGAVLVFTGFLMHETPNKTTAALITPSENDITFSKSRCRAIPSHSKPHYVATEATFEPLRAQKSHERFSNSKFAGDRVPALPSSRVTGSVSSMFAVSARALFMVARVHWSVFHLRARPAAHTHHDSQKLVTYPLWLAKITDSPIAARPLSG